MADESKPSGLLPLVRHMLICEHAESSPGNPHRANIFGIFTNIVLGGEEAHFPRGFGFTVYIVLTECRGDGIGRIIVSDAESGEVCYSGVPHAIRLSIDPLEVRHLVFRVPQCELPCPGLYWIEFEFDGVLIGQEPILVIVR